MKLDHLQFPDIGWGYMPPSEEIFSVFNWCQKNYNPKSVLEIGFHVGHSTTYMLETFENIKSLISISPKIEFKGKINDRIDPNLRSNTAKYMMDYYKGKFEWIPGTTEELYDKLHDYFFDFALIDGDHSEEKAMFDMKTCESLSVPYILIDNWERSDVRKAFQKSNVRYKLVKRFFYMQTFKKKTSRNEIALMHLY